VNFLMEDARPATSSSGNSKVLWAADDNQSADVSHPQ
jgi:hypothetical protein